MISVTLGLHHPWSGGTSPMLCSKGGMGMSCVTCCLWKTPRVSQVTKACRCIEVVRGCQIRMLREPRCWAELVHFVTQICLATSTTASCWALFITRSAGQPWQMLSWSWKARKILITEVKHWFLSARSSVCILFSVQKNMHEFLLNVMFRCSWQVKSCSCIKVQIFFDNG